MGDVTHKTYLGAASLIQKIIVVDCGLLLIVLWKLKVELRKVILEEYYPDVEDIDESLLVDFVVEIVKHSTEWEEIHG